MQKKIILFSMLIMSCNTTTIKNNTIEGDDPNNKTEKIEQVEITTAGGMQGGYAYCKINKDSIVVRYSISMDSTKNYSINQANNMGDWETFTSKINPGDFKKATEGESRLPVDGADTEIKIKTNKGEISKVNADSNNTFLYIRDFSGRYFKQ